MNIDRIKQKIMAFGQAGPDVTTPPIESEEKVIKTRPFAPKSPHVIRPGSFNNKKV